ncbi:AraC family transcriptional regulator [Rhizobium leguminosarum]|uniref:AraC family transcriptional regulator n=1 Tax=Rhizobium leguminosarum TaxID=384 RepID=UPI001C97A744|nr:AraC family transcriptional regulator [Rhizobium leguminosarum]MBY5358457.1 AraC family transcriptional regulator [Rhizobium leguminosarum]
MLANPDFLLHRSKMTSDPLSEMLNLLDARCLVSGGLIAGGAWALRFPRPNRIKISAVAKGRCWLCLDNGSEPILLEAGDVALLNGRHSFILASDLAVAPTDAVGAFKEKVDGMARQGIGEDFHYLGGHIALGPQGMELLSDVLPPIIHVRAALAEAGVLRWLLDQLVREMAAKRPGALLASTQLAQLMFVQVLRAHIMSSAPLTVGWLRAFGDDRIAPALRLMHGDPSRSWQLGELAKAAGMSRTSFALRFKTVAGVAPFTYLTGWRMRLAERELREGSMPVSALALSLGYTSESAFSNAFKRMTGMAPKRYRVAMSREAGPIEEAADVEGQAMTTHYRLVKAAS